jgi:hypothetical protein
MKKLFSFVILIFLISFVSAITWNRPTIIEATLNVNHSETSNFSTWADIWITSEGDMDDVSDISLDDLGDVSAATPNQWSFLTYVGTDWIDSGLSINATIDARTISVHYNATEIKTISGTLDAGDITSIHVSEDGNTYNVSEAAGASPLTILVNWTNVNDLDFVVGRISYEGGQGHIIQLELYRFDTNVWENYIELTDTTDFVNIHFPVYDQADHIDATGNVSMRFLHVQNGIPSHNFKIDYLNLVDGWSVLTTADHDALSGRDNQENHPWAVQYADFSNNINGSGNFTTTGYTQSSWHDFLEITEPATPPANTLRLYVVEQDGFSRINYKDELGVSRTINDDEIIVNNSRGSTIAAHRLVYVTGYDAGNPTVDTALANSTATMPVICVTIESIADGQLGRCMQTGLLENVNTDAFEVGTIYVSDVTAGIPTNTPPITPNLTQEIGSILVKSATVGKIQIIARALTGDEFGTINNFTVADGQYYFGNANKLTNISSSNIDWLGNVDLGSNDLTTTGDITANGPTSTAHFQFLRVENVGGGVSSDLTPDSGGAYDLGDSIVGWRNIYVSSVIASNIANDNPITIKPSGDNNDYFELSTTTNLPQLRFVGANGKIIADSGTIDFVNENLNSTGDLNIDDILADDITGDVIKMNDWSNLTDLIDTLYAPNTTAGIQHLINDSDLQLNSISANNIYLDVANKDIRLSRPTADRLRIWDNVKIDENLGVGVTPSATSSIYTEKTYTVTTGAVGTTSNLIANPSGNSGSFYRGLTFLARWDSGNNLTGSGELAGVGGFAQLQEGMTSPNISEMTGFRAGMVSTGEGTPHIIQSQGLKIDAPISANANIIWTTNYGALIKDQTNAHITSAWAIYTEGSGSNTFLEGNFSALDVQDRTPAFSGTTEEALQSILNIKSTNGEINHSSLPEIAQSTQKAINRTNCEDVLVFDKLLNMSVTREVCDRKVIEIEGRSLSGLATVQVEATKRLNEKILEQNQTIQDLIERVKVLEEI